MKISRYQTGLTAKVRPFRGWIRLVMFTLLVFYGQGILFAQQEHELKGTVIASESKEPVIGANVIVKGTTRGTVTNIDGKFSLMVAEGEIIQVSFIGYLSEEIEIGQQTNIVVTLKEDITKLDEVVVIGYGSMKRSDLTGAVVSVSSDDIKKSVVTSVDQALQGRAAGVMVTNNSGQPGGSVSVRIRGINTLNASNEPLYVIDGIPMESFTGNNTNALSIINTNDIASLEVLKDASATAIYGSRASNGVILITTKSGETGKTNVSYDGYYSIQQLPNEVNVMDLSEFAQYSKERAVITNFGMQDAYLDPSVLGEGTNWQKELFRNAPMQSHQLSINTGTEKTQTLISLGYLNQEGIAIGSDFNRLSSRVKVDNKATDWLKVGINLNFSQTRQNVSVSDGELINLAIQQTPDIPVRNTDGSYGGPYDSNFPQSNPVAEAALTDDFNKNSFIQGNIFADVELIKGLVLRNEAGGNVGYENKYYFEPTFNLGVLPVNNNQSQRTASNSQYWVIKNILTYSRNLGNIHDISLMAGHEAQESSWESLFGKRLDFFTNDKKELNLGDADTDENNSSKGSSAIESWFGRLNYMLNEKYSLTATYRADGSSSFGQDNRWGFFPSFAAAWKISKEDFMNSINQISNMKLRAGWGMVGNQQIDPFAYGATLGTVQSGVGMGTLQGRLGNSRVQWESTKSTNIGIDIYLINNRIEFIADAYHKKVDNLLMRPPYPSYVGTDNWTGEGAVIVPWINIGAMENKGLEFTLNTVNLDRGGFYWKSGITFSMNRNKVLKLTTTDAFLNRELSTNIITRTVEGNSVGQFYGYLNGGLIINQDDLINTNGDTIALPEQQEIGKVGIWVGDYKWADIKKDSVIDQNDRAFIGDPNPDFIFSLSNSVSYKGFDLYLYLTGVYGNKIYNMTRNKNVDPVGRFGLLREVKDYARVGLIDPNLTMVDEKGEELAADEILSNVYVINTDATVARINSQDVNGNQRISDRFIEDGSYLRIKNISIGYTLPKNIISRLKVSSLRFYLNIQNLYTFTRYSGYDPEVGSLNQDILLTGVDDGRYPSQRIYTFGMNINF